MDHYRNNNPRGVGRGGNGGGVQQRMAAVGSRREPPRIQPQPVSSLLGMVPGLDSSMGSGRGPAGGNGNSLRPMRNQFSGGMDQRPRNDFMDTSPGPGMSNPGRSSYDGGMGGGRPRPNQPQDRYWSSDYGHEDDHPPARNDFSSVMDTYGLSRDDLQELLQLPDHELSAANLAKVIDALARNKSNNYNNSAVSDYAGSNRTPSRGNGGNAYRGGPASGGGDRFDNSGNAQRGILGPAPMPNMPNSSRGGNYRDDHYKSDRDFDMAPPPRNLDSWNDRPISPPIGRPRNSAPNFRSRNDDSFDGDDGVGGGYHRSSGRRSNLERDLIEEDYSPSASRYNDEEDDYLRASQKQRSSRTAALRHEPRNARPRNLDESHRTDGRKPPPLMGRKVPPSNSLLGDPPRKVSSRSMDHIRPGRPEHALLDSASASAAALINSIPADPALIGAQIRAMRVLQMEALKLNDLTMKRERMERMRRMDRMDIEHERMDRMSRGGPIGGPSKNMGGYGDREEGGGVMSRKEKAEVLKMRQQKGRVLYMRFKSYRVTDDDLKNLAKPFGRVTRVFIIKAKGPSIMNQAFMELERYDCASAMLEHYFINPPRIKGCKILIDRSNYREWSRKDTVKRATSPSTGAKGGKRARISPGKKQTGDGKSRNVGDLNVQISSNERRVVTREDRKSDGKSSTSGDIKDRLGARRASEDSKSATTSGNGASAGSNAAKNQKKNTNANRRRKSAIGKRSSTSDTPADLRDLIGNDSTKNNTDDQEKKEEKAAAAGDEKNAAELPISDPLDAIADELAMDDDFVLMDSVGGDEKDDDDETEKAVEDEQGGGDLDCHENNDLSANIEVPDDIENLSTDEKTTVKQESGDKAEESTTTTDNVKEEIKQENKTSESSNVDAEKNADEEAAVASVKVENVESNTTAEAKVDEAVTNNTTEAANTDISVYHDAQQDVKVEAKKDEDSNSEVKKETDSKE